MGFKCGIVGLPNVGKSTLFNAITQTQNAEAANYSFCTIEPNIGRVAVPDQRLEQLGRIAQSQKIIYNQLEVVDIAGLVKGASQGEGRGNQFLSNIREVDAIIHVLRCFEDDNIEHVNSKIDPLGDAELIETELILADMQSLEKRLAKSRKMDQDVKNLLEAVLPTLNEGKPARSISHLKPEQLHALQLITTKPVLYVCNVEEEAVTKGNKFTSLVNQHIADNNCIIISAKIEEEIANLSSDPDERLAFLQDIGLQESGLSLLVKAGYSVLELITFFTAGPQEARAWSVRNNSYAPQAAGVIHTDFEKGFIKADVISYEDYIQYQSEGDCREAGKIRLEGKDYLIQDGDVVHFKFRA